MKNNEWLDLPIYNSELYPKRIRDIAKKVGESVEDIAKNEKISPGIVLWEWVKRDDMRDIFRVIEYPNDENMSVLLLMSGEELIVNMEHRKLMKRIHDFLLKEPQYKFTPSEISLDEEAGEPT